MSAPLRVLVADDERSARRRLLQFIGAHAGLAVVAECDNGAAACAAIVALAPDLVFLDVEMPGLNGLQVVQHIGVERMPVTIFATAFDHYAIAAFDANVIDYLLKPFDAGRFDQALRKARAALEAGQRGAYRQRLAAAVDAAAAPAAPASRLLVRVGDSQRVVHVDEIRHIGAEGNYVRLHTGAGQFLLRETMVGMLERLDRGKFRRIHRSHIVNLDFVDKLLPWFGGDQLVIMAGGDRLNLSRHFRGELADLLRVK